MKILFLSDDFPPESFGGAGLMAFILAGGLKERGHELSVITTVQDKSKEGVMEYEGVKLYRIYSSYHRIFVNYLSLYNPFILPKVEKIMSEIEPITIEVTKPTNIASRIFFLYLK